MNRLTDSRNRRSFLVASNSGFAGLQFGRPVKVLGDEQAELAAAQVARGGGQAKSVILFFLCGGASHIDTWDMAPLMNNSRLLIIIACICCCSNTNPTSFISSPNKCCC